jgi:hypothetical protein
VAEEQEALRPWARKGGDKKRKTGGVLREKEELFLSSISFDGGDKKKFISFICMQSSPQSHGEWPFFDC